MSGGFRPEMVESPSRRGHVEGARTRAVAQVSVTGCTPHRERIEGRDAYCSGSVSATTVASYPAVR